MPLIYIKLGTALNYHDERLEFTLDGVTKKAVSFDYANINETISRDLNAGSIVQIDEGEFWNIVNEELAVEPDINVSTSYLISIQDFIEGCPTAGALMFLYSGGKWFKATWGQLAGCLNGSVSFPAIQFRVGSAEAPAPDFPQNTETEIQRPEFVGKLPKDIHMTVNGVELYDASLHPEADLEWAEHYTINSVDGIISKTHGFKDGEIISIKGT